MLLGSVVPGPGSVRVDGHPLDVRSLLHWSGSLCFQLEQTCAPEECSVSPGAPRLTSALLSSSQIPLESGTETLSGSAGQGGMA